jgi:hypothetical protein
MAWREAGEEEEEGRRNRTYSGAKYNIVEC